MPAEELRCFRPRQRRRVRPVVRRSGVGERMRRARIGVKLMELAPFRKLGVKLAHIVGRGILIVGAEVSLDRAIDLARSVEGRRTFAERDHRAAAVEHHTSG